VNRFCFITYGVVQYLVNFRGDSIQAFIIFNYSLAGGQPSTTPGNCNGKERETTSPSFVYTGKGSRYQNESTSDFCQGC
jgi:hypothetical protein